MLFRSDERLEQFFSPGRRYARQGKTDVKHFLQWVVFAHGYQRTGISLRRSAVVSAGVLPLRDDNPTQHRSYITPLLIVACAAIYFLVQPTPFSSTVEDGRFEYRNAAIPTEVVHGTPLATCEVGTALLGVAASSIACNQPGGIVPYTPGKRTRLAVITSVFLHASILHLLGNMLYLWVFGNNVEDRLRPVGFLLFFLAGGIVATIGHVAADMSSRTPVVGASGAIAAVMGAYFVWYPRAKVDRKSTRLNSSHPRLSRMPSSA